MVDTFASNTAASQIKVNVYEQIVEGGRSRLTDGGVLGR